MKIEHETKAYFGHRGEAVEFAIKALGHPGNSRVWFSHHPFESADRIYKVIVESEVEIETPK